MSTNSISNIQPQFRLGPQPVAPVAPVQSTDKNSSSPRDRSGIYYSSTVTIRDPNSGEILLRTRGDV